MRNFWIRGWLGIQFGLGLFGAWEADARDLTPPFALNQRAPQLADLWGDRSDSRTSQLCATTAIANTMYWFKHYRQPAISGLRTPYDQNGGGRSSKYDLIRYFVDLCGTFRTKGTYWEDIALCVQTYFAHSKVRASVRNISRWSIGYFNDSEVRAISPRDFTGAIDHGYPLLASIAWYVKQNGKWVNPAAHVVTVYGYDGESAGTLMITDPWRHYPDSYGRYSDRVRLARIPENERRALGGHDFELLAPHYNKNGVRAVLTVLSIPMPRAK